MNRADRRKNKTAVKDPEYRLKLSDITRIKEEATAEASQRALEYTVVLPMLVLRDKFGFGATRCERFFSEMRELLDAINRDYLTIDEIKETLEKELGIKIIEK